MSVLLVAAAATTGGLCGFVLGVAWAALPLPAIPARAVAGLAILALAADAVHLATGRPAPPCLRRQVPREWGRLLPPSVAATLYGARLGVGPLTILTTWLWWVAAAGGASLGVGASAVAGASFGAARTAAMLAAAAGGPAMPVRAAVLRRLERPVFGLLAVVTVAVAAAGLSGA